MSLYDTEDSKEMQVQKRDGSYQNISFDKILNRVKNLGKQANISKIPYTQLVMKVIDQLYDKINTTKIDELTAQQCASMASTHPDYTKLASAITISNLQKNTCNSFYETMRRKFLKSAAEKGFTVIDMKDIFWRDFLKNQIRFNSFYDSHWNEYGHKMVSDQILKKVNNLYCH